MSGLLRRLTRRHPATADETGTATPESSETAGASADTPAEPGGESPVPATESGASAAGDQPGAAETKAPAAEVPEATPGSADDQATQVLPATGEQPAAAAQPTQAIQQPAPVRDLPAGVDPGELADAPIASARRGKLRRRLRYLRAVRDLLLRDLGGFTYEIERSAGGTASDAHRRLIEAKTNRLTALDTEVRGIESRLGEPHAGALLREPGIGGTCPECGELHASDAHYCARCGAPLDAKARARRDAAVAAAVQQTTGSHSTAEPAPASVLWAAGPRPDTTPEREEEEDTQPSLATSQWLALRPHAPAEKSEDAAKADDAPAKPEDAAKADEAPAKSEDAATPDVPAEKVDEPAAATSEAATTDLAETGDVPADKIDEPVATSDETATTDEPVAQSDETATADEPVAKSDEPATADEPVAEAPSERTAQWLVGGAPAGESAESDPPAPQTAAAKTAAESDDPAVKPKRPRAPRAKKPAATGGDAADKPKRTRAKKPAEPAPEFASEPNGRREEPVAPPHGDPLTSRPEQGS